MRPLAFLPFSEKQLSLLHRVLYMLGLMTIACGLAWSNALMSIGQFILAGNWLLEGKFVQKWEKFKTDKIFQLLLSFWLVVLLGFFWTDNFDYAFKDARIKFPLFLLPFVIGSSDKLTLKEWKILMGVYLSTLCLLYLTSLGKYFGLIGDERILDKRELSVFISHIRYGLNLLLGGFLAVYFSKLFSKKLQPLLILLAIFLFSSLIILQLYTALMIGSTIIAIYLIVKIKETTSPKLRTGGWVGALFILIVSFLFVKNVIDDFNSTPNLNYDQNLPIKESNNGNEYLHKFSDKRQENGVFVWRYVQEEEMRQAWNERSEIDFDGNGVKGDPIFHTMVRFLSSKGYRKDQEGVSKLSQEEIKAIEIGIPNRYYLDHFAIQNRIFTTLFELDTYQKFGYAEGYSLSMRLEYWKTALKIIEKNSWFGVGTGDVPQAFEFQYYVDRSSLSEKNRRRAHNQFLTIWLTFGIVGLIYFMIFLFYPLKYNLNSFYPVFFIIVFLSFFTEDTLETQAGATFFALFNSIFILGMNQFKSSE